MYFRTQRTIRCWYGDGRWWQGARDFVGGPALRAGASCWRSRSLVWNPGIRFRDTSSSFSRSSNRCSSQGLSASQSTWSMSLFYGQILSDKSESVGGRGEWHTVEMVVTDCARSIAAKISTSHGACFGLLLQGASPHLGKSSVVGRDDTKAGRESPMGRHHVPAKTTSDTAPHNRRRCHQGVTGITPTHVAS